MSITQMRSKLLEWNPNWRRTTVKKWSDKQIIAIYTKELSKRSVQAENSVQYKQLSFF